VAELETQGLDAETQANARLARRSLLSRFSRLIERMRSRRGYGMLITALIVLIGALASVLGARADARSDAKQAQLAFHLASSGIASSLKQTIQHEEDLVVAASAFFMTNPDASPAAFDRWMASVHAMARYPELENIGLVKLVRGSRLKAFEARLAANPVRPLGPLSTGLGSFEVLPSGRRPYYCLAVAGMARSAATYLPAGLDYCSVSPQLIAERDAGLTGYAPVINGPTTSLGVETPLYRGKTAPGTVAARRRTFVGWLGELVQPDVVLRSALEGHPNLAVTFRYASRYSHVAFTRGAARAGAQSITIPLLVGAGALGNSHEGWTVQTFTAEIPSDVFARWDSLALLIGGVLLSVVLGLLMLVLFTTRARALTLVREKTSELSQKNRELSHQALHDTLTGLPNRALVLDRTGQLIKRAARVPGTIVGALFIDVDGFKHVNDNLGHAAGDRLLATVGQRLLATVREQDTVGRLGGDEFVVLGEFSSEEVTVDRLADRITDVLREPIDLPEEERTISITASVGVAVGRYSTPDALLRDADLALYAAKAAGKDRYALFDASAKTSVQDRVQLQADLSAAAQERQFFLLYQPIFRLPSRELVGVEALIRWRHPRLHVVVPPDEFISLAEESGLIVPIGRWVLDEACKQAAQWRVEGLAIPVSVNVSACQLGRDGFVEDVQRALQRHGVQPQSLTLEITETVLMRNARAASRHLHEIKALGVSIAIDDFGTGYASLSQLQRLPVDVLKIDRSFVAALDDGHRSRQLLQAILGVGQALSLAVVAEGVETQSELIAIEEMGCEMCQGFLMGRPGPPEAIAPPTGRLSIPRSP
jgi:diguanylate cyclase